MEKLDGVIFDLDGVITDTAEYHYRAWKELAKRVGITIDREFNENLKGVSRMDSLEQILAYGGRLGDFNDEEKSEMADWKNELYKEMITDIKPTDILPGVVSFLDELKMAGVRTAVASASKNAETILEALKIRDRFDFVVDAAEIKNSKPDPEIFLKALELLELSADVCVGLEDAAAGIDSIKGAGIRAVGIGDAKILSHADIVLEGTEQLRLKTLEALA
ncbi:beta-phosphoglucomutase [Listeria seeligeri]|uniref:beta-phosphoglucomutase n=1 Tax=Listeria seeligeri TaxID=1640 RepID=UPI00162A5AF7|nr:beta-phosphoglucomutase [Listeria seeligeri]MBC1444790.1 beta-phosphoglucomutase [Listeria seeligeri]MBC1584186.1 beta-phosphoglucomutase [Listeria seeligeri]MBC1774256.1 beta-phosphoglucomutase [Listeria seeligeri]MBC1881178.1 beta-phosphoglucomutase [Listeria seeligeri]MBC2209288.1 beta-phosphoglucomutase [Listeria seeligeri]